MKSFAGVVNVDDLKVVIEYEKMLGSINSMSDESPLDKSMSSRVNTIGMMTMLLTELLNVWRPSIRIIDKRVGRFHWRDVCDVAVNLGLLSIGNEHVIPIAFI